MAIVETEARLWRWQSAASPGSWHFLTIEGEAADEIRVAAMMGQWLDGPRGFGSARVTVRIGETSWKTSVFPDKSSGGWFLPVKKAVRAAEDLAEGDIVRLTIAL